MENYLGAKKLLFEALDPDACAITNLDDEHGRAVVSTTRGRVLTYSARLQADVTADRVHMDVGGIHMNVATPSGSIEVTSPMTGRFNVENILAAVATGAGLGIAPETIAKGIASMRFVPGRFEQIPSAEGWTAVIDYAHTPDALEQCLKTVRELLNNRKGRIITVFGCGGDRDTTKRPIMGRIASQLSDITIVTSDNPRTEDPERIIDEVLSGVLPGRTVERVVDRRAAIAASIAMAKPGDILLLAGKGHEDYQVIGHEKHHFDDKEELLKNMTPAGV
jgi:UDP-N-acetylmuramoyl-L-alanyl-D-glutamate--2,6-diaminopimelate ligase